MKKKHKKQRGMNGMRAFSSFPYHSVHSSLTQQSYSWRSGSFLSSFHLITNECKGMRESSERKKEKEPRLCSLLFLFAFVLFVLPLHFITKEQMQRETKGQRHKINQQHEVDELSEKNPN